MGQKPSYIDRMEYFILNDLNSLAPSEAKLFLKLFHLNNKAMWAEWFTVGNHVLSDLARLDERNLLRTKKGLKAKGLIDFKPGRRGKPSRYKIYTPEERESMSKIPGNNDIQTDIETDILTDIETTSRSQAPQGAAGPLRLKTKDIRHREGKKRKTFSPPTLEEVRAYVQEKRLPIDPQYFYDYFTEGDWHDSKGQPVKNWKQKALTWARHSRQEAPPPEEVTLSQEDLEKRQRAEAERQRRLMERET